MKLNSNQISSGGLTPKMLLAVVAIAFVMCIPALPRLFSSDLAPCTGSAIAVSAYVEVGPSGTHYYDCTTLGYKVDHPILDLASHPATASGQQQPAPQVAQPQAAQQQVEAAPVDQRVPLKPYRVPPGSPPPSPHTSCIGQADGSQQCWRND